jgi:hypothetical protein
VPLRLGQGLRDGVRAPAADHLGDAFVFGFAGHDAVAAHAARAVGGAAVAALVLREAAAGFLASALERLDAGLGQMDVAGEGRRAEAEGADQDEQDGSMSHGSLPTLRVASPGGVKHRGRGG